MGRALAHLHLLAIPVLGQHGGARTQPQAVPLPPDGELHLGGAIGGKAVQAQLAGDFHRAVKVRSSGCAGLSTVPEGTEALTCGPPKIR